MSPAIDNCPAYIAGTQRGSSYCKFGTYSQRICLSSYSSPRTLVTTMCKYHRSLCIAGNLSRMTGTHSMGLETTPQCISDRSVHSRQSKPNTHSHKKYRLHSAESDLEGIFCMRELPFSQCTCYTWADTTYRSHWVPELTLQYTPNIGKYWQHCNDSIDLGCIDNKHHREGGERRAERNLHILFHP